MFKALCWLLGVAVAIQSFSVHAEEQRCERIVSLAPSVTEVLFDVGLGSRLVGATRFCRFPAKALAIARVGGMYDVSVERIALSRPTDVFVLRESAHIAEPLARMGIRTTVVDHRGVEGIQESYRTIGQTCGLADKATARIAELQVAEREIRSRCSRLQGAPTKVMVVVGRAKLGNVSSDIYISGRDGFYSDVLRLLGAVNVNSALTVAVPSVSAEGIVSLNPDAIFEVVNVDDGDSVDERRAFWSRFARISAVVNNRVFILDDDFASIPGPRYIQLAKKLSSLLCDA